MGKENINFLTAWIILGNVFATFSTDPEPTAISNSTDFGKSGTSTSTSLSGLPPPQEILRRANTDIKLIALRCFALTENNPMRHFSPFSRPADLQTGSDWRKSFVCRKKKSLFRENFSIQSARSSVFSREKNGIIAPLFIQKVISAILNPTLFYHPWKETSDTVKIVINKKEKK